MTPGECVALLVERVEEGDAGEAAALLEALVRDAGPQLAEADLFTLGRCERIPPGLRAAVEAEMRRRGVWRRFRLTQRRRLLGVAARWIALLPLLAIALLAAVFGAIIGGSRLLYYLGF